MKMKMFSRWLGLGTVRSLFQRRFRTASPAVCRRRRRLSSGQQPETLERRLALAASAFEAGDDLVLVVSDGDDLYVSETGTSPSSLLYGTSSSFVGTADEVGVVPNLDRFSGLLITEAATESESLVVSDATPGWGDAGTTTSTVFIPRSAPNYDYRWAGGPNNLQPTTGGGSPVNIIRDNTLPGGGTAVETRGQIRVRQPDGTESNWAFTNWNQQTGDRSGFNNQDMRIISGPGYGGGDRQYGQSSPAFSVLPGNYYYPTSIAAIQFLNSTVGFEVRWNRPLPSVAKPKLILENYLRQNKTVESRNETVEAASDASQGEEISFTLREASGRGVVPGAIRGELFIPARGVTAEFFATSNGSSGDYEIHFEDQPTNDLDTEGSPNTLAFYNKTDLRQQGHPTRQTIEGRVEIGKIQVEGDYDDRSGILSFRFASGNYDDDAGPGRLGRDITGPTAVGEVQLRNVRYAVYDQNLEAQTKSTVQLLAGLSLTQGLTIDMLTPGAELVINSPVDTEGVPGRFEGEGQNAKLVPFDNPSEFAAVEPGTLALRASSITLNADIDAQTRIDVGYTTERSSGSSAIDNQLTSEALGGARPALAIPEINEQQIARVDPVIGHRGSGYRVAPKVVVAKPRASAAAVSVASFVGGLTGVRLTNSGDGYEGTQVNLIISPPDTDGFDPDGDSANGIEYPARPAVGVATIEGGKIASVVMTDLGFGYSVPPAVSLPAPTRTKTADNVTTLDPDNVQATVSATFGGLITRLSIDAPCLAVLPYPWM